MFELEGTLLSHISSLLNLLGTKSISQGSFKGKNSSTVALLPPANSTRTTITFAFLRQRDFSAFLGGIGVEIGAPPCT